MQHKTGAPLKMCVMSSIQARIHKPPLWAPVANGLLIVTMNSIYWVLTVYQASSHASTKYQEVATIFTSFFK